jgi:hypothetical protein
MLVATENTTAYAVTDKESGHRKDMSAYSLEDYTRTKHVMAKID